MLIEQAIFASAETDRAQGYQVVARSPGLSEADARELAIWGPSHDSLLTDSPTACSVNFHRLASGAFAVSRTALAGAEYSGRGGGVYTQFLVVPPEVLRRFANNPFSLLRAATAAGAMRVRATPPETLEPLRLGGRASVVDLSLMAQLARDPGPGGMATLIQAALASDRLAIGSDIPCERLVAGLFSTLPVECRPEVSFSTGLRFSPRRAVRISALSNDRSTWRAMAKQGFTLVNLDPQEVSSDMCWQGWAGFVAEVLAAGTFSALSAELEQARPGLTCADLDNLAAESFSRFPAVARRDVTAAPQLRIAPVDTEAAFDKVRADAAHVAAEASREEAETAARLVALDDDRGATLAAELSTTSASPETVELLERIDDLIFAAIAGDEQALNELEVLWPTVAGELDAPLVEQSREHYLRCALSICSECVAGGVKRPERAVAAIDVLCVLFEE